MTDRSIVVRLRAEVNQAVSGLDKVASASDKAAVAVAKTGEAADRAAKRQQDAAGRLRVAEAQLLDVQQDSSAKASQLVAAEENVARARRGAEQATKDATHAERVHAQATSDAAGAAGKSQTAFQRLAQQAEANKDAWSTAGTALSTFGGAITALGVAAGKTGIEYNTLQQTSRAAMTTLMNGAAEANRQMDKLDAFAKNSPFSKATFIQAQQQMIGFGIESKKVIPYLEAIQDAVAATGGGNQQIAEIVETMSKIRSASKITGQDLIEFGNRGLDAAGLIGEQMGKTGAQIREDITDGALGAEEALDALTAGMSERFGGAAADVKNTFDGAVDRVKAAWRDLSSSLAEPLVGPEGGGLAIAGLNKLADAMREFESLPRPIRDTGLALTGIVGAASLAGGGFLLLMPRILETQQAFQTLAGQQGVVGKAARGIGAVGTFAQKSAKGIGVATVALGALAVAAGAASSAVEKTETKLKTSELLNGLKNADSAAEAMANVDKAFQGVVTTSDKADFTSVNSFADALDRIYNRTFNDHMNDKLSGFFKTLNAPVTPGFDKATAALSELDGALTELAQSGDFELAQQSFARMASTADDHGVSLTKLMEQFPQYKAHLTEIATEAKMVADEQTIAKIATGQVSSEMIEGARAAGASKESLDAVAGASTAAAEELQKVRDSVEEAGLGFLNFAENADNSKVSTEKWIADFEKQVKAQADWVMNLEKLGERGASSALIDSLVELGTDGAQRVADLANGADSNIERLNEAFASGQRNAGYLTDAVVAIPDVEISANRSDLKEELRRAEDELDALEKLKTTPVVSAQIDDAKDRIKEIEGKLDELDGKVVKTFVVTDSKVTNMPENLLNPNRKPSSIPTGDDIRNRHLRPGPYVRATGGAIHGPGTGTSDDILMWASNGEHVLTAAEVDLLGGQSEVYRMRQAIRAGNVPAFAAGGAVGAAQSELQRAEKRLDAIQNRGRKVTAQDREREAAQKRVERARDAVRKAEEAQRKAEQAAREEQARRQRVRDMQTTLRTDVRRGSIRDQVTGSLSGGYSAVDRLFNLGENEDLSKSSRNLANSRARKFEADLRKLYGQAERLDEKLKTAQDKAKELEGIQSSVTNSLLGGRELDMGDYQSFSDGQWTTHTGVQGATRRMTADVGRMKEFADKLGRLQKAGIPGVILQEIAQAGVDEGIALADAFLDASQSERQSYLGAWSDYEKQANRIGTIVTGGFYDGGVQAAQGVVKGLESQQKNVEAQIAKLAKAMESTLKQVLGIKSPSRVMAELGGFTAEGLAVGMLANLQGVQDAATRLAAAAVPQLGDQSYSVEVGAAPVAPDDDVLAGLAVQDMSAVTLSAMQEMQAAVNAGWAGMLTDTQTAQQGMLAGTQQAQFSMRDVTAVEQEQMRALIMGKQTQSRDAVLAAQESMRATVADRQAQSRAVLSTEQEQMRAVMADKQAQMRSRNLLDFESMRATTGEKLGAMRSGANTTMSGMTQDYTGHMGALKGINRDGHQSMQDASAAAFRGIRSGMDAQMSAARPELGGNMNQLIDVLGKFVKSVNEAFGDIGVKLDSPNRLAFATGGVMPGYTPGRDVHSFYSPTAGSLYLSGGEAIMRPEFTRLVGGEQGVEEINAAARRGDVNELSRMLHFARGGVMPAMAPIPGVTAFADSGVWRGLWSIVRGAFPRARLTSAYRPGSRTAGSGNASYHSRGMAVDLGGAYRMDTSMMGQIGQWLVQNYGNSNEIIYSPMGGRQIHNGRPHMYTGVTRSMHYDHVHWANRSVPGGAQGGPAGAWDGDVFVPHPFLDKAGVSASGDLEKAYARAAKKQLNEIIAKHSKQLGDNAFSYQLGKGVMEATRKGLTDKATEYGKTMGMSGGVPGAANGPVRQMAREILEKMGWGDQWGDLDWLVTRESGWRPTAQNPSSTAYGIFQFLNSTWGTVGATKTSDPLKQIQAGIKYIQQRYGDVRGARRFWERNHWYKNGTQSAKSGWAVVGEEGPELINLGGGEKIHSNPQSRAMLAANRTVITPQAAGVDYERLAKALGAEIAKRPQILQQIDSRGLGEEQVANRVMTKIHDASHMYG
jgi:tape measure domain-containing protein